MEFFAASMSLDISNTDKLAVFYQDARRFKIPVRAPDVNRSGADFEVENGEVVICDANGMAIFDRLQAAAAGQ